MQMILTNKERMQREYRKPHCTLHAGLGKEKLSQLCDRAVCVSAVVRYLDSGLTWDKTLFAGYGALWLHRMQARPVGAVLEVNCIQPRTDGGDGGLSKQHWTGLTFSACSGT